jgi:hypothetical protein
MFPVCGRGKYMCISLLFRHLRNFPEIFRRFPEIYDGLPMWKNKRERVMVTVARLELTSLELLL